MARLPKNIAVLIVEKINEMGHRLDSFPHYRMTARDEFRLRIGDYRLIYNLTPRRMKFTSSLLVIDAMYIARLRSAFPGINSTRR